MNYTMKDCDAFCIASISLKLLLSKILLFSHFVGEPNYWSVVFHPRNSNSWTFLNFSILLFFLLYLYLILKYCLLCLCHCKQSGPRHCVTHNDTNCITKPEFLPTVNLVFGVSLLIHSSVPWPFLFTLSRFIRLFAFGNFTFSQYEMMKVDKRRDYI